MLLRADVRSSPFLELSAPPRLLKLHFFAIAGRLDPLPLAAIESFDAKLEAAIDCVEALIVSFGLGCDELFSFECTLDVLLPPHALGKGGTGGTCSAIGLGDTDCGALGRSSVVERPKPAGCCVGTAPVAMPSLDRWILTGAIVVDARLLEVAEATDAAETRLLPSLLRSSDELVEVLARLRFPADGLARPAMLWEGRGGRGLRLIRGLE